MLDTNAVAAMRGAAVARLDLSVTGLAHSFRREAEPNAGGRPPRLGCTASQLPPNVCYKATRLISTLQFATKMPFSLAILASLRR